MSYLGQGEMPSFRKQAASMPQQSPTGVANYDEFDDNVVYESLRPDHVFKLIENLECDNATIQLKRNKHIAQQWVINAGTRRLPLHEACVRQPKTEIVYTLLDLYPKGAKAKDSNGRHPIHHACVHGASADVICQLLDAFPESGDAKDNWGKTSKVYALNTATPDVDVIQALFHKSQYDIATTVSRLNKVHTAVSTGYGDYYDTDKPSQLVPYDSTPAPVKSPVESMTTYHVMGINNAHNQRDIDSFSGYTQRGVNEQKEREEGSRLNYLVNKSAERGAMSTIETRTCEDAALAQIANRALSTIETSSHRDAAFSQMGQFQQSRSGAAHAMVAAESRKHDSFFEVERLQDEINQLRSQAEETKHLKAELSRAKEQKDLACSERNSALGKVSQFNSKMSNLEAQLLDDRRSKEIIMKKDVENDMLRNINKDLRGTIISLSRKLNTVMKDLDSVKSKSDASHKLVNEVRHLKEYRHVAESKIEELAGQESGHVKMISKLNDELEELNSSYFDVTNALVVKSKDFFRLKAELDETKKLTTTTYHYS